MPSAELTETCRHCDEPVTILVDGLGYFWEPCPNPDCGGGIDFEHTPPDPEHDHE